MAHVLLAFEPPDGRLAVHVGQLALGLCRRYADAGFGIQRMVAETAALYDEVPRGR